MGRPKKSSRIKADDRRLSREVKEQVLHFMAYHPAQRLNKNLRKLLIEFLQFEGAGEASYLNDLLYDMEGLFNLLDVIQEQRLGFIGLGD